MTKEMFEEITKWQDATFTKATSESALNHLTEELRELQAEFFSPARTKERRIEFADCFLLLFGAAHKDGMSYDDICNAIYEKMEVNQKRQWGKVNEQGYVKHITFKTGDVVYLKEDLKKEPYTFQGYTKRISRGPVGQLEPSPVVSVKDHISRFWEFREDSLQLLSSE